MPAVNYVIFGFSSSTTTRRVGASHWKNIVAVVTQDKVTDDNSKRQIKNRTCIVVDYSRLYNLNFSVDISN